ncbi:cytochrome oxidase [Mesorhizobium sp. M4B.F.Ca.ET.215.01.1.1]|uniref:FixH family protein n=1 Tax=Mesorhizobium TaxID=68287 RepID=UPI000FCBA5F2|nr:MULTISPECIES: FixH family protein [Mesorhizobium]RVC64935.1 cytochrome oxidase [Mesorhizobium sp. M4B.F.Ca.ET.088.02.2.1]MDX8434742.1 FixH family protein [Mesorhizobium abyssinicae]RUW27778.1 cytochrome oxidase [Mesorhizobium sp. M4B.F.Ca.ET.013.02.1.1]RUW78734.1 cytochrome oxidase [Mesorhizobium sp. M4B.F.Ca.ET.049.02.1.2]RVD46663.1 cytochrome oxidase [Mesorhizobium sp. M4B.F.Ca.ET.019.03.1.1]
MSAHSQRSREFTGRHMLFTILGFFGVVIGVNVTMATLASKSWTGLVVENTYVASQQFNRKAEEGRAQAALGWTGELTIVSGNVRYSLSDAAGKPVPLHGVKVRFRHPAYEAEDKTVVLASGSGQEFGVRHTPKDGVWIVEIDADAGLAEPYRDVRRIMISHGALQ